VDFFWKKVSRTETNEHVTSSVHPSPPRTRGPRLALSSLHISPPNLSSSTSLPYDRLPYRSQFSPLVAPQSSPAKITQIPQASSTDATSVCHLENPVVPCHTQLTRPLASRVSVWTVSLLGTFLLYKGSFKTLFVRSFIFLLSTSRCPLQPFPFYLSAIGIERRRFCLTLVDGAPAVARLYMIQYNFFHSGRHLPSPSSLAGPQLPSPSRSLSPSTLLARGVVVLHSRI